MSHWFVHGAIRMKRIVALGGFHFQQYLQGLETRRTLLQKIYIFFKKGSKVPASTSK